MVSPELMVLTEKPGNTNLDGELAGTFHAIHTSDRLFY